MSRKKTSQHMVVLGYSFTYGLVNDARGGEAGFLLSRPWIDKQPWLYLEYRLFSPGRRRRG